QRGRGRAGPVGGGDPTTFQPRIQLRRAGGGRAEGNIPQVGRLRGRIGVRIWLNQSLVGIRGRRGLAVFQRYRDVRVTRGRSPKVKGPGSRNGGGGGCELR
ncbi:MAG TPA: hypothetical protein VEC43_05020, partial [Candidatus Acidoferrales bacterium]|nr:hypothetical protein [Candidatus Acidoferrales bacterium]